MSTISVSASKFAITKDGSTLVFIVGDRIRAMDVTLPGSYPVRDVAGNVKGYADGVGTSANFRDPTGITITPDGKTAFVADNQRVIRSVDMKTGAASTLPYFGGVGGLALTPDGSMLLVSDSGNNRCAGHPAPFCFVPQCTR